MELRVFSKRLLQLVAYLLLLFVISLIIAGCTTKQQAASDGALSSFDTQDHHYDWLRERYIER